MQDDRITVVPAEGDVSAVAKALLALAASPLDVMTTSGGTEFMVPPYLADLYNAPPKPRRRTKKDEEES